MLERRSFFSILTLGLFHDVKPPIEPNIATYTTELKPVIREFTVDKQLIRDVITEFLNTPINPKIVVNEDCLDYQI